MRKPWRQASRARRGRATAPSCPTSRAWNGRSVRDSKRWRFSPQRRNRSAGATSTSPSTNRWRCTARWPRARAWPVSDCARTSRHRSAVHMKAPSPSRAWWRSANACSSSARSKWPSATPSAWRTRGRSGMCSTRCCRGSQRVVWRCTSTTRAARRSRTCWPRSKPASRRSIAPPAGSAAVPTLRARPGISPRKISVYLLDGLGIETGVSLSAVAAASAAVGQLMGRALPSRYVQAVRRTIPT